MTKKTLIVGSGFMGTSITLALKSDDISCVEQNLDYLESLRSFKASSPNISFKLGLEEFFPLGGVFGNEKLKIPKITETMAAK